MLGFSGNWESEYQRRGTRVCKDFNDIFPRPQFSSVCVPLGVLQKCGQTRLQGVWCAILRVILVRRYSGYIGYIGYSGYIGYRGYSGYIGYSGYEWWERATPASAIKSMLPAYTTCRGNPAQCRLPIVLVALILEATKAPSANPAARH